MSRKNLELSRRQVMLPMMPSSKRGGKGWVAIALRRAVITIGTALTLLLPAASADAQTVTEIAIPARYCGPGPIRAGPDGSLWFKTARPCLPNNDDPAQARTPGMILGVHKGCPALG